MGLLGWVLPTLLGTAAIALTAAAVWSWQRPRKELTRSGVRLALVLGSQLCAVLTVAALLNDYGYFYGSWDALFSAAESPASDPIGAGMMVNRALTAPPAAAGRITGQPDPQWSTPRQYREKGELFQADIYGPTSHLTAPAYIYLPPQYFQPRYRHVRFPGTEVLSGYPGNELALWHRFGYQRLLLADLKDHAARPMVLVMQQSSPAPPRDTECTDVPDGPQAFSYFAQDVTSVVPVRFRVERTGWGAIGASTGGMCAAKLALMQPSLFDAAVSLSGYYNSLEDHTTGNLWGHSQVLRDLNTIFWRLTHLPQPASSLLLTAGSSETGVEGYRQMYQLKALAKPPLRVTTFLLPNGGHNFRAWTQEIPHALSWLSARQPPPVRE